jgi:hypothetical protein
MQIHGQLQQFRFSRNCLAVYEMPGVMKMIFREAKKRDGVAHPLENLINCSK